ncbi:MAG: LPS biosynthesis protein [Pelagibacterales bacterium]|nr:LPS biosynthesis protein [Pelagibacterales bacterium]|tara:strand:+ start:6896 stop:7744 length:849 start_codon:yes stop_codon:yes gene_type:complete
MKIALGTAQWGMNYGISNSHGIPSDEELKAVFSIAQKNNINLFDTAFEYGNAEKRLGQISVKENKIITKVGSFSEHNCLKNQLDNSFKNLDRKKIYGCLFHNSKDLIENRQLWTNLKEYKKEGKINKIGYSLYEPSVLLELLEADIIPDVVQVPYNVLDRKFEPYFDLLKGYNVEIHCRSVFLQGLFFKSIDELGSKFQDLIPPFIELEGIAKKTKFQILSLALCFVLQNPKIDYVVLGVETSRQLNQIIVASKQKLSKKLFEQIKSIKLDSKDILNPVNWK